MSKDQSFLSKMGESFKVATPSLQLQAFVGGKKEIDIQVGSEYRYYDWASLTKIVFSTSLLMRLYDEKRFNLDTKVKSQVLWYSRDHSLKNLLSHSAGLIWWKPYYKEILLDRTPEEKLTQLESIISSSPIFDEQNASGVHKSVYSDLDLFLLSFYYTKLTKQNLLSLWTEQKERIGFDTTNFHYLNRPVFKIEDYAPTENSEWRAQVMQGQVHDENTWALGGIAPHAGLFGEIAELSRWGLKIRQGMRGDNVKDFATSASILAFTKRAIPEELGDWASGFMMPTKGHLINLNF